METGCRLGSLVVMVGEECTGSRGGHKGVISRRSRGIPSEGFSGVNCRERGYSLNAGELV